MNSAMLLRKIERQHLLKTLFLAIFFSPALSFAQFSSPFKISYSTQLHGNQSYVEIEIGEVTDTNEFEFTYTFTDYPTGESLQSDSTLLPNKNSMVLDNVLIHRMVSPDRTKKIVLNFKVGYKGKELIQQSILMPLSSEELGFAVKNVSNPTGFSYVKAGDEIVLESVEDKPVYLYKIEQDFWASAPPMLNASVANSPSMVIEAVVQVQTNKPFALQEPALYFAQTDTTSQIGLGIKVTEADFPKFRKIKRVIEPMLYISTQAETKVLRGVDDPKEELDKFWLNLGGSPDNARKVIKRYFQRVSYANHNFTGYKQGWKTDRGIIYIVFGKPDRVVTSTDQIQWIYQSSGGESTIQFDFKRKPNQFTGYHYDLVRDSKYKSAWNNTIALWRNGLIR